jgi:CheY-like chemotaxis protein
LPSQFSYAESRTANKVCGFCINPRVRDRSTAPSDTSKREFAEKNGFEILAEIEASESLRSTPVIIFTSASLATERKKALALGADDYISKPRTLDGLIDALKSVCNRFLAEA